METNGMRHDTPQHDWRKLTSVICHQEITCERKRRWLMSSVSAKDFQKKAATMSKYLPESLIRSDDVSYQTIKASLKLNGRSFSDNQRGHHVVQDYLQLFDLSRTNNPAIFLKTLSGALNNLKADVLEHVVSIVSGNKIVFGRTRRMMKRAAVEKISKILLQSNNENHVEVIKDLSLIFKNPSSFQKQMRVVTPITASLFSSIKSMLDRLDDMPSQVLLAMDRKLHGVAVIPQLPVLITCKRGWLINRVQKQCLKNLSVLGEGNTLPVPFAKALAIMTLSFKLEARKLNIPTTEFFLFTPETEALQNDILMAIWSIPKVKTDELKKLQNLMGLAAKLPFKTFRSAVSKFLVEYLFACDDIDTPKSFLRVISFINRKSRRKLEFHREVTEDDIEPVMNVSSQLKQILWDSFPEKVMDQVLSDSCMESSGSDDDANENDIIVNDNKRYSGCGVHVCGTSSDAEMEGMGDSDPADPFVVASDKACSSPKESNLYGNSGTNKEIDESGKKTAVCQLCLSESGSQDILCRKYELDINSYHSIETLSDKTSLLAHGIIDRVLEGFLAGNQVKGAGMSGGCDDMGPKLVLRAVEELVPSFPPSGLDRARNLMGIS